MLKDDIASQTYDMALPKSVLFKSLGTLLVGAEGKLDIKELPKAFLLWKAEELWMIL